MVGYYERDCQLPIVTVSIYHKRDGQLVRQASNNFCGVMMMHTWRVKWPLPEESFPAVTTFWAVECSSKQGSSILHIIKDQHDDDDDGDIYPFPRKRKNSPYSLQHSHTHTQNTQFSLNPRHRPGIQRKKKDNKTQHHA